MPAFLAIASARGPGKSAPQRMATRVLPIFILRFSTPRSFEANFLRALHF